MTERAEDGGRTIRAVVFDYGHTLIDFAPDTEAVLRCYDEVRRLLAAEVQRDVPEAPELVETLSRRVDRLIVESYERGDPEEQDIVALYGDALTALGFSLPVELVRGINVLEHRAMASSLRISPANLRVLRELRSRGFRLGIVSNAALLGDMMREDIARLGIADLVDAAVFSAEIGVRKPHPAIFLQVLNALGVDPEDAVFVGDRLRDDIAGANRLGMYTVLTHEFRQEAVTPETAQPDAVIESLPELLGTLDR